MLEGRAPGGENRTALAAVYPPRLCTAILRGIAAQKAREGEVLPAVVARRWREGRAVYDLEEEKPKCKELAALAAERAELESQGGVTSAVFSPIGPCVLTASGNDSAKLWSTETGDLLTTYDDDTAKPWSTETGDGTANSGGPELDDTPVKELPSAQEGSGRYWDDVTGVSLPPDLVAAARSEEIAFMQAWGVWEVRPIEECIQRTGKKPSPLTSLLTTFTLLSVFVTQPFCVLPSKS